MICFISGVCVFHVCVCCVSVLCGENQHFSFLTFSAGILTMFVSNCFSNRLIKHTFQVFFFARRTIYDEVVSILWYSFIWERETVKTWVHFISCLLMSCSEIYLLPYAWQVTGFEGTNGFELDHKSQVFGSLLPKRTLDTSNPFESSNLIQTQLWCP